MSLFQGSNKTYSKSRAPSPATARSFTLAALYRAFGALDDACRALVCVRTPEPVVGYEVQRERGDGAG